jgi:dTMP kinase
MSGALITIEGIEGCGKTTQIARLKTYLEARGHRVEVTREPGGTPIAEAIRAILLDPANTALSPTTELLLYEAARAQHVDDRITPALKAGKVVLCDRFADSTTAYQGAARGLPTETVQALHAIATRGVWPRLTIVIDVPVEIGLKRAGRRSASDRIEQEPVEFHERVRAEFLRLAEREPARVKVVNGALAEEVVADAIARLVDASLEASE